jgi:hypothetical protein
MRLPPFTAVGSFWKRAAPAPRKPALPDESDTERLREAMLDMLHQDGSPTVSKLTHRILSAAGSRDLWYLRGDLMSVLSQRHGEARARDQIAALDPGFRAVLPCGMPSGAARRRSGVGSGDGSVTL